MSLVAGSSAVPGSSDVNAGQLLLFSSYSVRSCTQGRYAVDFRAIQLSVLLVVVVVIRKEATQVRKGDTQYSSSFGSSRSVGVRGYAFSVGVFVTVYGCLLVCPLL